MTRSNTQTTRGDTATGNVPEHSTMPIRWVTPIAHTRHRWWWYLVVGWSGFTFFFLFGAAQQWDVAAVILIACFALIVINVGKPRVWVVTVTKAEVRIERPGHRRFDYTLRLSNYRGLTVLDMPQGKRDVAQRAIALLPSKRVQLARFLILPADAHEADMLIQQLSDVIPYEDAAGFKRGDALISRVAQWIGVS